MKDKIKDILNLGIDIDQFYCISIVVDQIQLQGTFTASLLRELSNLGYEFNFDRKNEWFLCKQEDIRITLTL